VRNLLPFHAMTSTWPSKPVGFFRKKITTPARFGAAFIASTGCLLRWGRVRRPRLSSNRELIADGQATDGLPLAAKIAFHSAGANGGTPQVDDARRTNALAGSPSGRGPVGQPLFALFGRIERFGGHWKLGSLVAQNCPYGCLMARLTALRMCARPTYRFIRMGGSHRVRS
jgi:hypothetical protein